MSRWNTVAIVGVGLIGGSVGMALRQRGLAKEVLGIGRNRTRLEKAIELGAITKATTELEACGDADIVVLCAPVERIPEHAVEIAKCCSDATLITDAGSTKEVLVERIEQIDGVNFIGSHPLAGSDRSGVEYSHGDLFVSRVVVVTPTERTPPTAVQEVTGFWEAIGARVTSLSPVEHDRALALTSHLPHVVAAALAAETPISHLPLIAGGWRDTTRIAAADVELWKQILHENKQNVAKAVGRLRDRLQQFESALAENDFESVSRLLEEGKQHRDALGS